MTGDSIKYLCALLNTKIVRWFVEKIAPTSGTGTLQWKKAYVGTIPIPIINADRQRSFNCLVDMLVKNNSDTNTSVLEKKINYMAYQLYGLTNNQVMIIEGC